MSVFERVTRSLVQEMDSGGDMIPVKSMVDAGAFKCGYLVRGRKRFWGSCYYKTDLTLEDILDKKQVKGLIAGLLTWIAIAFWTEEKRSFQGGMTVRRLQAVESLQEQVQDTVRSLQELNEEERKTILYSITSCATKEGGLEDLEQRVYEVLISYATQAEGPKDPLICSLHDKAGCLVEARAEVILELLDALIELPEQGKYVTEAIKNGTLSSLRDKVESILQKNWGEQISQAVTYDPEARLFCALYIASSLLLELIPSNKSTCVCS